MDLDIQLLNKKFKELSIEDRINELYKIYEEDEILFTSSFGTSAIFLIFIMHKIRPTQKIHFIDTGYHFQETLTYKNDLTKCYNLNVATIRTDNSIHIYTKEQQLWESNPNMCCQVNKVEPLNVIKSNFKIWISGLMAFQSTEREQLNVFEQRGDLIKFYPLIDISEAELESCKEKYDLPEHPLMKEGFSSVGCTHCTIAGQDRSGRWVGKGKVECGLHFPVEEAVTSL